MGFKDNFIVHIFLAYIYLSSGLVVNLFQCLSIPLWYVGFKDLYRKIIRNLNYLNWCLIPGVAQWWSGMRVFIYARPHEFQHLGNENTIAILNHKGQLDWIVSWVVSEYCNILGNAKCIVKSALRYIPILGWAFWMAEYIFLKRRIEKDRKTLAKGFKALQTFKENFWILIFCEGTRYTPERHRQSNEYAAKNNLKPLKHLLQPKTKGFVLTTQGMRESIDWLYDATVCFQGDSDPTLLDMINGKPCKADFIVRRRPVVEIPHDEAECSEYLRQLYQEKDEFCGYFKKHDTFPINGADPRLNDYVRKEIPRNKISLFILLFWSFTSLVPLFYYATITIIWGSMLARSLFSLAAVSVALVFQIMLKAGKPKGA